MMPKVSPGKSRLDRVAFQFVHRSADNITVLCDLAREQAELADITERCSKLRARLTSSGNEEIVALT